MDIECRRTTTTPGGEEYVRWSGVGVWHHTGSLSSGCQSRRLGSEKQDIMDGVVASDPVPVAPTANLVVSKGVRCANSARKSYVRMQSVHAGKKLVIPAAGAGVTGYFDARIFCRGSEIS